jgi:hypothetical protein
MVSPSRMEMTGPEKSDKARDGTHKRKERNGRVAIASTKTKGRNEESVRTGESFSEKG